MVRVGKTSKGGWLLALPLLPVAFVQATVRAWTGDPYLPAVYNNPGPEKQRPIAEDEDSQALR